MKCLISLAVSWLLLLGSIASSHATVLGYVYCDANTNGLIDSGDVPVQGVLVIVTNVSGTFSNANWTTPEGFYIVGLQDQADSYVEYIHPETLPAGTTAVIPVFATFTTTGPGQFVTNNFLIENPACVTAPPPSNGKCWLTGGGTIKDGKGKPVHSFGGVVNPGCSPTAAGGGNWNDVAHAAKLHFQGLDMEVVNCGNVAGHPPGSTSPSSPFNYIEFQGVGRLDGIAGNNADYGIVYFFAHAEDLGEPGKNDRLYLRVYNGTGDTLLLISSNPSNPTQVAPVTISTGNLQMHPCK